MIFLVVVWIVVIAGSGAMLAGWAMGPAMTLPTSLTPELAALAVVLAVLLTDIVISARRALRR